MFRMQNPSCSRRSAIPFLKWPGGKRQLLPQLEPLLPSPDAFPNVYIENFVGAGAMFFHLVETGRAGGSPSKVVLNDSNYDLMNAYHAVQNGVEELIESLKALEGEYLAGDVVARDGFYYQCREKFNRMKHLPEGCVRGEEWVFPTGSGSVDVESASLLIFLNKTGFNGLYRVNRQGQFNVSHARPKKPLICDEGNFRAVNAALSGVTLVWGAYHNRTVMENLPESFVYADPPYRPLSKPGTPTPIYSHEAFRDADQKELAQWLRKADTAGAQWMMSNSDPRNTNPNDDFFDRLYEGFHLRTVTANRSINSNGQGRGAITELVATNYP